MSPEELAQKFHETYERLAPEYGYTTREASAVPWDQVPLNNRNLMVAVCREILHGQSSVIEQAAELYRNIITTEEAQKVGRSLQ